jgi:hypothetical protein
MEVEKCYLFGFLKVSRFLWDELEGAKAWTWKVFINSFLKSTLVSVAWVQVCESLLGLADIVSRGKVYDRGGLDHWNRCPFFSLIDSCDLISTDMFVFT